SPEHSCFLVIYNCDGQGARGTGQGAQGKGHRGKGHRGKGTQEQGTRTQKQQHMELVYFNGKYLPKEEVRISPDDRGFLLADGVYEVVRWYGNGFYDIEGHMARLKRSLASLSIDWPQVDQFKTIATDLIRLNMLGCEHSMVYLQVTRGEARRSHNFPAQGTLPTIYAYSWGFTPDSDARANGIKVITKEDIRWKRCDIKSIALLPNTLSFQEAYEKGTKECIFIRDGIITECSHSNVFMVTNGILYTHPESNLILSGITRSNVIRISREAGITVSEEQVRKSRIKYADEIFITNTSSEITAVTEIDGRIVGTGKPGRITTLLQEKFDAETFSLKRLEA
ncbi:MAG TPA: D-amino-acid transaminase, partial [Bacteroidales bacterium]|nr:D-amino-acid transaminase [Bacteroidales bacterium]